jgi:hypothetical protein
MATIPTPAHPTLPESPPASAISRLPCRYGGNPGAQWIIYFIATTLGGIAAVLLLLWALNDFHGLGLDAAGTVALMLGITLTSALGVGLMALVFYSDRSNADEDAHSTAVSSSDRETKNEAP